MRQQVQKINGSNCSHAESYSKKNYFHFVVSTMFLTFCCITNQKSNIQHQKFGMNVFVYSNIFRYEYLFVSYSYHLFDTNIFGYSFVSFFWYKYIRIFIRIIFLIWIYSDIRSYCFLEKNIFEYSFVSKIHIRHTLVRKWRLSLVERLVTLKR